MSRGRTRHLMLRELVSFFSLSRSCSQSVSRTERVFGWPPDAAMAARRTFPQRRFSRTWKNQTEHRQSLARVLQSKARDLASSDFLPAKPSTASQAVLEGVGFRENPSLLLWSSLHHMWTVHHFRLEASVPEDYCGLWHRNHDSQEKPPDTRLLAIFVSCTEMADHWSCFDHASTPRKDLHLELALDLQPLLISWSNSQESKAWSWLELVVEKTEANLWQNHKIHPKSASSLAILTRTWNWLNLKPTTV